MKHRALILSLAIAATAACHADTTPAADHRMAPPKDLDGYFPFTPSPTRDAWAARATALREQILVSLGLWPMPEKILHRAVMHGKIERDDYTVEKVYFESAPGFFVTGNLYRPRGGDPGAKRPGVLCPHGHWTDGRFLDTPEAAVKKEIADGAEKFAQGGRSVLQARCVQLARMGCTVFHYDMLGYADSIQISFDLAHKFAKQRPDMNGDMLWGLFSPRAESHLQSIMGLQALNGVRALDFITSLPDVDPARIGVTGASGGGTQTFILGAIDPRPAALFPAVMVGTAMQGGCTCENASLMRIGTGNVEFAALAAPKPVGMTAANDWTKEMPTKGYPQLQQHWAMLGAPDHVHLTPLIQFGHNYNAVSRAAMYEWFNKHLGLNLPPEKVAERDYQPLTKSEMTVWDEKHFAPRVGPIVEKDLLRWLTTDAEKQLAKTPALAATGWRVVLGGRTFADAGDKFTWDGAAAKIDRGSFIEMSGPVVNETHQETVNAAFLYPKNWNGRVVLWLDGDKGKFAVQKPDGHPAPAIQALLDSGTAVAGADLFRQGEAGAANKKVANPRESASYTYGYNSSLFVQRVQDVLTLVKFIKSSQQHPVKSIRLCGVSGAGAWAAGAAFLARDAVSGLALNSGGFRFHDVTDFLDPAFTPGGAKYGDLPGLLNTLAPMKIWLTGEADPPADLPGHIRLAPGIDGPASEDTAAAWLRAEDLP